MSFNNWIKVKSWTNKCICCEEIEDEIICQIFFTIEPSYSCTGDTDVSIGTPTGGTGPYEYSLDGINYQTNGNFTNFVDGVYTFYVRDSVGCVSELEVEIIQPPEFDDTYWWSSDGDKLTGSSNNISVFACLGNSQYLIKASANDPVYFDFTAAYTTFYPLVDGTTYNISIDVPIVTGSNPRIFVEENSTIIFDTGFGAANGIYTFSFTYNTGDDLKIWFDKNGGGAATFKLVTFNIM